MNIEKTFDFQAGEVLLFDKPKTWTSFDVVKKVRGLVRIKKVGHAGTLDPLATGLLILCTGKATKSIQGIIDDSKEYEVIFRLGATTPSHDSEFEPEDIKDTSHITQEMVVEGIKAFTGEITQIPPQFSAVKIDGKRAYKSARKGKVVELRPREVTVEKFSILEYESPEKITAVIRCSKGTYIRSLVHDLGQALGVGGYILELRRTKIGDHSVKDAWQIPAFQEFVLSLREETSAKEKEEESNTSAQ